MIGLLMTGEDQADGDVNDTGSSNPVVKAWELLKADIDTQQIQDVIYFEEGRPKIDPAKAKELAKEQNPRTIQGATGGAIAGVLISVSGALSIPLAAVGAALGYAIDRNAADEVEKLEEDFEEILEAIEDEEEVDLARLAMITHIKKEVLAEDYLPYLEEQGFVEFDENNDVIVYSKPVLQQAASFIRS